MIHPLRDTAGYRPIPLPGCTPWGCVAVPRCAGLLKPLPFLSRTGLNGLDCLILHPLHGFITFATWLTRVCYGRTYDGFKVWPA